MIQKLDTKTHPVYRKRLRLSKPIKLSSSSTFQSKSTLIKHICDVYHIKKLLTAISYRLAVISTITIVIDINFRLWHFVQYIFHIIHFAVALISLTNLYPINECL